jgi:hypothetical protein
VTDTFWACRAGLTPDAPFIGFDGQQWSYRAFDRWSNELAHGLAGPAQGRHAARGRAVGHRPRGGRPYRATSPARAP